MDKLYDRIDFYNNSTPALNATNLNQMSKAIDDIDDRVIDLAGSIMEDLPEIIGDLDEVKALVDSAEEIKEDVNGYKVDAYNFSRDSEAWAVGTKGGVPVPSTEPQYENSAKYWAEHSGCSITDAEWTQILTILS